MARKKRRKSPYIPPPQEELTRKERAPRSSRSTRDRQKRPSGPRRPYEPPPPSWGRVFRRVPLYFAIILAVQYYMSPTGPQGQTLEGMDRIAFAAFNAALVTLLFTPVMYFFDRLHYNRWLKRQGIDPDEDAAHRARDEGRPMASGRFTRRRDRAAEQAGDGDQDVVEGNVVEEPETPHSTNGRPRHVAEEEEQR